MAKILSVATDATGDQTKATSAFVNAVGARRAEKEVAIAPIGEAAYLLKEAVANAVHGVGFPPLSELIEKLVKANVPVYV